MYELMENLKDPRIEAVKWLSSFRLYIILYFISVFPNVCGQPLSGLDVSVIGLGTPYIYYIYLQYKEYKDV